MNVKLRRSLLAHALLLAGSLVMSYPLLYALAASFSSPAEYARSVWLPVPRAPTFDNYRALLFAVGDLWLWVANTLLRAGWSVFAQGAVAVLCGYAFGRLRFRGREALFLLLLCGLLLPPIAYYVPRYLMLARWPLAGGNDLFGRGGSGFVGQWPALLLPDLVSVYYIFLMRQTFQSIDPAFEEAARIDGAGTRQVFAYVYLPLLKPALIVMAMFKFVFVWNDYLWPLMVGGGNRAIWTVALAFQQLMAGGLAIRGVGVAEAIDRPFFFAVAVVGTLPPLLVFVCLQRFFVEGAQGFAVKG